MNDKTFNFNIGLLGHVDSGKTSLAKALSTTASTACFDKNPQSRERGITIDLGFSSFFLNVDDTIPEVFKEQGYTSVQITLVDCPGHASLFRTVIGGAQIIDLCLLLIDATKGMQTQTSECLILAEVTSPRHLICVVNKIDLIPEKNRNALIEKLRKKLQRTFDATVFKDCEIVFLSACVSANVEQPKSLNLDDLLNAIKRSIYMPARKCDGENFLMQVDHCFGIKGQGTIMTGTVLAGSLKINQDVFIPQLKVSRKVKSIQMFRKAVDNCQKGDRVGMCVRQIEAKTFERGFICSAEATHTIYGAIASFKRIEYFKSTISSKSRFHLSMGHETVMARCRLLTRADDNCDASFDPNAEYTIIDDQTLENWKERDVKRVIFVLLELERSLLVPTSSEHNIYIALRLDSDIHTTSCRIAFYGHILLPFTNPDYKSLTLPNLNVVKYKRRSGKIDRIQDSRTLIVHSLIKKETDINLYQRMKVTLSTGERGIIENSFGKSGKVKIILDDELNQSTKDIIATKGNPVLVNLDFKKKVFADKTAMMFQ